MRAADEGLIDRAGQTQEGRQLGAIDPAAVQGHVDLLAREHGVQRQPREMAVFQVFQLFLEHRAGDRPVAVQQRAAGVRAAFERGLEDGQHGRDAAATGHREQVPGRLRERRTEAPLRRHHVEHVTCFQLHVQPSRKGARGHPAHADTQGLAGCSADRVRAPDLVAERRRAQRQVLARRESEQRRLFGWHVERHQHRVRPVGLHAGHTQRVEMEAAVGRDVGRALGRALRHVHGSLLRSP